MNVKLPDDEEDEDDLPDDEEEEDFLPYGCSPQPIHVILGGRACRLKNKSKTLTIHPPGPFSADGLSFQNDGAGLLVESFRRGEVDSIFGPVPGEYFSSQYADHVLRGDPPKILPYLITIRRCKSPPKNKLVIRRRGHHVLSVKCIERYDLREASRRGTIHCALRGVICRTSVESPKPSPSP